jgi:hypothetical protein
MKPRPKSEGWREALWAGKLDSRDARALLSDLGGDLASKAEIKEELALNELLGQLPAPSVSSNLASRVAARIFRVETPAKTQSPWSIPNWKIRWVAGGAGIGFLALASLIFAEWSVQRREAMARSVVDVTQATAVPGIAVLQDFDAIAALAEGTRPHPGDVDLMAAMAE